MDQLLEKWGIKHILIPPRTPWHNGKVERSHRNDQRYFYDWETFRSVEERNEKRKVHLKWSNNKTMRTLGRKKSDSVAQGETGGLNDRRLEAFLFFIYLSHISLPRRLFYRKSQLFLVKVTNMQYNKPVYTFPQMGKVW